MVVRVTSSGMGLMFDDEMEMIDNDRQNLDQAVIEKRHVRAR